MKPEDSTSWLIKALRVCAVAGLLLLWTVSAQAWPWASEPQPLLEGKTPIRADAGSPLAWDQSAKLLWFIGNGELRMAMWWKSGFQVRIAQPVLRPRPEAGLLADPGWHTVFYVAADDCAYVLRFTDGSWQQAKLGDEPISRLLAVDTRRHAVFAYDAQARGIRRFAFQATSGSWTSELIATGLGPCGDAGVFDATWNILYTTHQDADASIPRHPSGHSVADPSGFGELPAWPLVAISLHRNKSWSARVIDETGVPQLPAVQAVNHRVFYAKRDEPELLSYYQPKRGWSGESFGTVSGWDGQATYEDHDRYTIQEPQYPGAWASDALFYFSSSMRTIAWPWLADVQRSLEGPITVVPYYAPVWTETAIGPRLTSFRALLNPRQRRLVQHRQIFDGEVAREQTGQRLAGYLYRDANGVLATEGTNWNGATYPKLNADFDPAHPPAHFDQLASPAVNFYVVKENTTLPVTGSRIPTYYSLNPDAPFVPRHLSLPTDVTLRTFGHCYGSKKADQVGGRYRQYLREQTSHGIASSIAVDARTGVTFYTQAPPPPSTTEAALESSKHTNPPLSGFGPIPEPKVTTAPGSVWIVMVY